jgi:hypothetical protein
MTVVADREQRFPFRIGRWSRIPLVLFGVTAARAWVVLDDQSVDVKFGFLGTRIALAAITRWDITGPYRWIRAIGVRHTWGSRDISFCGADHGGVRLTLASPRRIGWVNADEVYLGVDDLEGFAAALSARGIEGDDIRTA